MIIPDIIVTWPRSTDYPLWREYIRRNRTRLNEVIVVFMETNQGHDYRDFVRGAMFADRAFCLDSPTVKPGEDWRNVAVNAGLEYSLHSEYIWFTEQDFFPLPGFWNEVEAHNGKGYIGIKEGDRIHPASLFVQRSALQKTTKNFSIVPNVLDHFGLFVNELQQITNGAILSPERYMHLAGLSHNLSLIERGEAPNHNVIQLKAYLEGCLKLDVPVHDNFIGMINKYLTSGNVQ